MARIPKIWYRKDRRAWFVTIRGSRHILGPNKKEATERFHQLMGTTERKAIKAMSLVAIADLYLEWQLAELRPYHCQQWVDSFQHLSQSTRRIYLRAVRRVVNWAILQGYIANDPLKGLQMPAATRKKNDSRELCI